MLSHPIQHTGARYTPEQKHGHLFAMPRVQKLGPDPHPQCQKPVSILRGSHDSTTLYKGPPVLFYTH
jgi:hypothetical protein